MVITEEQAQWMRIGMLAFLNSLVLAEKAETKPNLRNNKDFITVAGGGFILLEGMPATEIMRHEDQLRTEIEALTKEYYSTVGADA